MRPPPSPPSTGSIAPVRRLYLTSWATGIPMLPIFSVIYRFDVRFKGSSHTFQQRWSACEGFHKAITKDLKLPKGAEFKAEFPSKRTKMKNFEPEAIESRRAELDAYFGELAEWARNNGMAVVNLPVVRQFLFQTGLLG